MIIFPVLDISVMQHENFSNAVNSFVFIYMAHIAMFVTNKIFSALIMKVTDIYSFMCYYFKNSQKSHCHGRI